MDDSGYNVFRFIIFLWLGPPAEGSCAAPAELPALAAR